METVVVKQNRTRSLRFKHPWLYSGSLESPPEIEPGAIVRVVKPEGEAVGYGFYNASSKLAVRIVSWNPEQSIDADFWRRRLLGAIARRDGILGEATDSCRLIHSESDGFPGLILDRLGDWLVVQIGSLGIEKIWPTLCEQLVERMPCRGIWHASDIEFAEREGLSLAPGLLHGDPVPDAIAIRENGFEYRVRLETGQKTGFFLDQRENRRRVESYLRGDVLDAFCYTGSFSLAALRAGASRVVAVDSSKPAMSGFAEHLDLNGLDSSLVTAVDGNAFEELRKLRDRAESFDTVILDPPKLAANRSQLSGANRAYKDINLLGMKLLRSGGHLITFSCSRAVSLELFRSVLLAAARDARREVRILETLTQGADHPVLLNFPESDYLKGFVLRVEDE